MLPCLNAVAQHEQAANADMTVPRDYTFSCWVNGWRKNSNDRSPDIFGLETSQYGLTLDLADFRSMTAGRVTASESYAAALRHKTKKLVNLPAAELVIEIEIAGTTYRASACEAGKALGARRLSSVRLWESGRFVQHYDILGLDFRDAAGKQLECEARLDVVAWPGSFTLSLIAAGEIPASDSVLRLGLNSSMGKWSKSQNMKGPWQRDEENRISLTCPLEPADAASAADVSVTAARGKSVPVRFNVEKNCHEATATRLSRGWKTGYTDIRNYDEFEVSVSASNSRKAVPFLLHLRPPANVTGVCPILCDKDGRPTGIPVQLSKNWHYKPTGSYVMAYAMLPANKSTTYLMRFAYGFYGTLPSASHSQLSLIGYGNNGGNGRWDQLAIGCWGESICFDMDMSLVDVAITDIRMLMTRRGKEGKKWSWTNAGWGGDWLNIRDANQAKYFQNQLKTAYLSHGPCLTDVRHNGFYGANQEVDFSAQIQTLRTDDYCRTFQRLSYTFTRGLSASRISLFGLGRTHSYQTPRIAYGNIHGLTQDHHVPDKIEKGETFISDIGLAGEGPHWIAFVGASEASPRQPKPNGYRAIIVRSFRAVIDGEEYSRPTLRAVAHAVNPTNLNLELLPPAGIQSFHEGDCIKMDVELITLPRDADDYYGPNESFREHLQKFPESWKTTFREAKGNHLHLTVSGGNVLRNYPVLIAAEEREITVKIQGGVGAVPVTFQGLPSDSKHRLYQVVGAKRIPFDQSVHGNDFWQTDIDAAANTYSMTFNVPLDELEQSVWTLAP